MTEPNKKSRGIILKESRESKGLSLRTVHEMTKIPMDVLKGIEEGYTVRTLSEFYLKGFIKMYAHYLGIDDSEVLSQEAEVEKKPDPKPVEPKKIMAPERNFGGDTFFTKERQQLIVKVIGALIVLFIVVKIGGCIKNMASKPKPSSPKIQETKKVALKKIQEQSKPVEKKVVKKEVIEKRRLCRLQ